jgi:hypothetical protein
MRFRSQARSVRMATDPLTVLRFPSVRREAFRTRNADRQRQAEFTVPISSTSCLPTTRELNAKPCSVNTICMIETRIRLIEYDPEWPHKFECEANRIRGVLGNRALNIEHVGSTSVPALVAKPIIDIVLVVPESGKEDDCGRA